MSSDLYPEDDFGLGAYPSPPDPHDYPHTATAGPASFARRLVLDGMGPVLNQGNLPQCVSYASAGMKMWEEKRDARGVISYDTAAFYRTLKQYDGIPGAGSNGRTAMKVLKNLGMPESGKAGSSAHNKVATYWAVPTTVAGIKNALATTGPVLTGGEWYASWFHPIRGILPKPAGGVAGGHETLIFGADDDVNGGSFLVRNSWGADWPGGVNGNFYVTYAAFLNAMWEAWVATDVKGD